MGLNAQNSHSGFPAAQAGMTIGLLGGSFDPPHAGHVQISKQALRRLGLHQVWWLVSPGNPLKPNPPRPIEKRLDACRVLLDHPRILATDVEQHLGTRFTAQTLAQLQARYPGVRFVWLMGADNLAQFHKWQDWNWIVQNVPIAVFSRPDQQLRAGLSVTAQRYATARVAPTAAGGLAYRHAPAWVLLDGPMTDISSTKIRANGSWS